MVFFSSVMKYLDNPDSMLLNFYNQLKDNGYLIFSVPNKNSLNRNIQIALRIIFKTFNVNIFNYLKNFKNSYNFYELKDCLAKVGFKDYRIYKFDALIPHILHKVFQPSLYVVFAKK